jgi:hypothetical protein
MVHRSKSKDRNTKFLEEIIDVYDLGLGNDFNTRTHTHLKLKRSDKVKLIKI